MTVPSIPSMHICLDFIPELLSQANISKQVFAVDLVSHLSLQYALPKSMSIARLAINTLSTLITGKVTFLAQNDSSTICKCILIHWQCFTDILIGVEFAKFVCSI